MVEVKAPLLLPSPLLALVSTVSFPTLQEISKAPEQFFSLECQKKKKKKEKARTRISWKHFFGVL